MAFKLVLEQGMSLEEAGESLALQKGPLANWVAAAKRGDGKLQGQLEERAVHLQRCATRAEAKALIREYVEILYNR